MHFGLPIHRAKHPGHVIFSAGYSGTIYSNSNSVVFGIGLIILDLTAGTNIQGTRAPMAIEPSTHPDCVTGTTAQQHFTELRLRYSRTWNPDASTQCMQRVCWRSVSFIRADMAFKGLTFPYHNETTTRTFGERTQEVVPRETLAEPEQPNGMARSLSLIESLPTLNESRK